MMEGDLVDGWVDGLYRIARMNSFYYILKIAVMHVSLMGGWHGMATVHAGDQGCALRWPPVLAVRRVLDNCLRAYARHGAHREYDCPCAPHARLPYTYTHTRTHNTKTESRAWIHSVPYVKSQHACVVDAWLVGS